MPIRIQCPHCDAELRLPDALYDRPAQCPRCSGAFSVRWRRRRRTEPLLAELYNHTQDNGERKPCPFCGGMVRPEALKCPHCREWFQDYR